MTEPTYDPETCVTAGQLRRLGMKVEGVTRGWVSRDGFTFILGGPVWSTRRAERAVEIAMDLSEEHGMEFDGSFQDHENDNMVPASYRSMF